jgi:hypothetical protein
MSTKTITNETATFSNMPASAVDALFSVDVTSKYIGACVISVNGTGTRTNDYYALWYE